MTNSNSRQQLYGPRPRTTCMRYQEADTAEQGQLRHETAETREDDTNRPTETLQKPYRNPMKAENDPK